MTTSRAPSTRAFAWHGRVAVRALFFGAHLHADEVARRTVAHWQAGTRLFALDGGVLLVHARDTFLDARTADGEVFVDVDGVLSALPLRKRDRDTFARGSVVYARGGVLQRAALASLPIVDVATLIDVDAFDVVDVVPLAPPPPPTPPPERPRFDARAALLGDTAPNPERDAVARAFREGRAVVPSAPADRALPIERGTPVDPRDVVDAEGRPVPDTPLRRAQMRAAQGTPTAGAGDAIMRALASALESIGVLDRLRRMQRDYVEDTLERLKRGELDDALRRAIPLGRPGDFARPAPPSLAMPTPRANLHLNTQRTAAPASSITLENDLLTRLRNSYRDAAKKLEREGRYREAAFVHVELLGEIHEAIALLERAATSLSAQALHDAARALLQVAAQLAESWDLPAGVVVRQWILAGEAQRAVDVARRRRAFGEAIAALERSNHRDHARSLRFTWADHLANAGSFAAAVDVLAPHASTPEAAARVERFLERGIEAGGADVPRLLARRVLLDVHAKPADPPRDVARVRALVHDDGADGAPRRLQLAYALGTPPAALHTTSSSLLRALYADAAAGLTTLNLKLLAERLADPVLRADLPASSPTSLARHPSQIVVLDGPPGRSVAHAVALLPEGRVLVGVGEAGAFVSTRKGGAAWRTSEPCDEIVLSDAGDRAILVARRGTFLRLARARLSSGVVRHLVDLRADHVAHTTDGDLLFLARDLDLLGLDILDDDTASASPSPSASSTPSPARILWQSRLRGPVFALARDDQAIAALHDDPEGLRLAIVDARTLAPREMRVVPDGVEVLPLLAMSAAGEIVGAAPGGALAVVPPEAFGLQPPMGAVVTAPLAVARGIAALGYLYPDGTAGVVVRARPNQRLILQLRDAEPRALFVRDTTLVVADDRGRAFVVDAATGTVQQAIALPG